MCPRPRIELETTFEMLNTLHISVSMQIKETRILKKTSVEVIIKTLSCFDNDACIETLSGLATLHTYKFIIVTTVHVAPITVPPTIKIQAGSLLAPHHGPS